MSSDPQLADLAVSGDGAVAAGILRATREVVLIDTASGDRRTTFGVTWDFGGKRVALSHDGKLLATCCYGADGVALYAVDRGLLIWRRRDLLQSHRVVFVGARLLLIGETGDGVWLDAPDGASSGTIRGARSAHVSPDARTILVATGPDLPYDVVGARGERLGRVPRTTFAVLDAAFADDAVVYSESGGPVTCCSIASGEVRWRYTPEPGNHLLTLATRGNAIVGIDWPYQHGGTKTLVHFDLASGRVMSRIPLPAHREAVFTPDGERVVLSTGAVLGCRA